MVPDPSMSMFVNILSTPVDNNEAAAQCHYHCWRQCCCYCWIMMSLMKGVMLMKIVYFSYVVVM